MPANNVRQLRQPREKSTGATKALAQADNRLARRIMRPRRQPLSRRRSHGGARSRNVSARRASMPVLCGRDRASVAVTVQSSSLVKTRQHGWAAGVLSLALLGVALWPNGSRVAEKFFAPTPAVSPVVTERLLSAIDHEEAQREITPAPTGDESSAALDGVPTEVRIAIRNATEVVGIDAAYLTAVAERESHFDTGVRAHRTSATGLYQFTKETWLRVVKLFGAKYGLEKYAQMIVVDEDGHVSMPHSRARAALLELRDDPRLSALMAAELAQDNKTRLERLLRREATPAETYMAHFFGVIDAARIIHAAHSTPRMPGAQILPTAAQTNPGVFSPQGHTASVGAIVAKIEAYFDREVPRFAST
jgi:hypothetical protein